MSKHLWGLAAVAASLPRFASAAEQKRVIGANDRIRIAQVGCGNRGRTAHMEGIHKHVNETNFEIVAVVDPYKKNREAAAGMAKTWFGRDPKQFVSYRDLIAWGEFDAVMIASPDFHHTTHLEALANAGKHIYVEKPLATEMDKLVRAYDAAKAAQAKGSIIQVGTQLRSLPGIVGARDVVTSGVIGKISRIDETRNSTPPYWYSYLNKDIRAEDVDWKEFLGDRKARPFDARQISAWYGYYEFCQGPVPQWGAHFLDLMHFVTGCGLPESCMCMGGVTTFKDDAEVLAMANDSTYGLGGGLWTSNLQRAHVMARSMEAGMVWINCYKRVNPGSPFGGVGASGYGREMGFEAMHEYTEPKSVWINVDANIPPWYPR